MNQSGRGLYRLMRWILGAGLGFYFRRIERFHAERVPLRGPVLFASNHPNSLTDSFVIGAAVPRTVYFVATVQLFRFAPVKWLLSRCGVIPINRLKDDPKGMRSVAGTFEACHRVLEHGEAVGIFPEGITYEDSRLKEVKSGAARMALDLECRHHGKLGLQIVPVGLTYSAKELYRSDVLVHFGEPIRVSDYLACYADHRRECIAKLTAEIERRLQTLILHIPSLEHARVAEGVRSLYVDRLRIGTRVFPEDMAEEFTLRQRIADAVANVYRTDPERALAFAAKLDEYERWLKRLTLSDESVAFFRNTDQLLARSLFWTLVALLGAPIAIYGWLHRLLPHLLVRRAVTRFTEPGKRKAQISTAKILAGTSVYGVCFGAYMTLFHLCFGWPMTLWYALSLPPASLLAFYHLREIRRFKLAIRNTIVLLRAPFAARKLMTRRAELIREIELVHSAMQDRLTGQAAGA